MKIGIDYDGTISEDQLAFCKVAKAFLDNGHDVAIVTWRPSDNPYTDIDEMFQMWGFKVPIIYCNGKAKRNCYPADIWIEDNPAAVLFGLDRKPRFVENARDYDEDVMVCENSHGTIETTWKLLNPKYL